MRRLEAVDRAVRGCPEVDDASGDKEQERDNDATHGWIVGTPEFSATGASSPLYEASRSERTRCLRRRCGATPPAAILSPEDCQRGSFSLRYRHLIPMAAYLWGSGMEQRRYR